MEPLNPDDLLPLEEYAVRRDEFFEAHLRYCDQYRRIRIGPQVVLLFENRQTLWFRVQEMLRVLRQREPQWVQRELEIVNRLLPRRHHLQAALILNREEASQAQWDQLTGDAVRLMLDAVSVPAKLVSSRPEERVLGLAHWLEFALYPADRKLFADFDVPAWFEVKCPGYEHASGRLTEEVRQSLLDDLSMSDRDAA